MKLYVAYSILITSALGLIALAFHVPPAVFLIGLLIFLLSPFCGPG